MTRPDRYSPALGDWRLARTGWILAVDGQDQHTPSAFHQITYGVERGVGTTFQTPSGAALHLSAGWKAAGRAAEVRSRIRWIEESGLVLPGRGMPLNARRIDPQSLPALYDYFEECMGCLMASFAAIEAFCNGTIVGELRASIEVKRRNGKVPMTAEQLEEKGSTEEKLKSVLPKLLKVPTPAGKATWERFRQLKLLRDSVTHFKRRDEARSAHTGVEPTALHLLLNFDPFDAPECAVEVIRHFFPTDPPRWLVNPAWTRPN